MKKLNIVTASLAVLAGCAAPGPNYYGSQAYPRSGDPSQWQVVSVTPVPLAGKPVENAAPAGMTGMTGMSGMVGMAGGSSTASSSSAGK